MKLRILLAALVLAVVASGCSLPVPGSSEAPSATAQPAPGLEAPTAQPQPAPATGLPQGASGASSTAGSAHIQQETPTAVAAPAPVASPAPTAMPPSAATATVVPVPNQPAPVPLPAVEPSPSAIAPPPPALTPFSGQEAWEHVRNLADEIGSRPSGSEAKRDAAAYISEQLIEMGYSAELETYSYALFRQNAARLVVEEPQQLEVDATAIVYSGDGSVNEELVFVGLGRPSDFPDEWLQGRIALVERGQLTFEDKVANAAARGASAIVIHNNQPGAFQAAVRTPPGLPAVTISQSDGQRLRELLRQGAVVASVTVEAATETADGQNVVAPGPVAADRRAVVIGAHYDSVEAGPGGNDNASGVGTMLEIARVTRDRSYPFDLVFVAFGDEEIGLIGSKRHVQELGSAQRNQIVAMINLDMVGVGETMQFGGTEWLADLSLDTAREMGYRASRLSSPMGMASDHASFMTADIPSVFFYRSDDPNYHTARDTAQKVQPEYLEAAGRVALEVLDQLSKRQ